jgi:glutamine synthetase
MVPSSESIAGPNVVMNTTVAEVLSGFADILEKAKDIKASINQIVVDTFKAHKRIIFNGNNYADSWIKEAEKRGLPNITSTVDAIPEMIKPAVIELFEKHKVLSKSELESRCVIYLEKYIKQITIEAKTMISMSNRQIFPAVLAYTGDVAEGIGAVKSVSAAIDTTVQEGFLKEIVDHSKSLKDKTKELEILVSEGEESHDDDILKHARFFRDRIVPKMSDVRFFADKLETLVEKQKWPFPTYEDLLFRL